MLAEFLASRPRKPFDWGLNHCCHFAAQWVEFATGKDPTKDWPSRPSAREALRFLRSVGGFAGLWDRCLSAIDPRAAVDGDLLLVDLSSLTVSGGEAVGVCTGRHAVMQDITGSLFFVPRDRAVRAWACRS